MDAFLKRRRGQVPAWWADAKLGIFVHWVPASVPGFAPTDREIGALLASDEADSKAEAAPSVRLREMGTYRVECHNKGRATTTAQLTVTSADEAAEWSN